MREEQEMEQMAIDIAEELDLMSAMFQNMGRWFTQSEREDTVDRATQFEYLHVHTVEITTELMSQLEQYLFF